MLLILFFREYDAVEIAANQIAKYDTYIYGEDRDEIGLPECERNAEIVECVSNAVRESAYDEERNSEKEREILLLLGKLNGGGHDEAAADAEKSAAECTCTQAKFQYVLCCCLDLHRSDTGKKRCAETSYDVS